MHFQLGLGLECHKCQERDSSGITQSCFSDDDSYGLKETCPSGSPYACYKDVKRNVTKPTSTFIWKSLIFI